MEMKVGDRRSVDARVGVNVPNEILHGHARVGDQTTSGSLRVSYQMIATLHGPGFKITRTTPEQQMVAEGLPTVWEWDIEAKQDGVQELEATLYALIPDGPVSGNAAVGSQQRIDTYTQNITVSVKAQTWGEWLQSMRDEINAVQAIAIALGGLGTAVIGWLGMVD
jgi:hypothetical protein